ncbi:Dehydrogenase/reductase SDR family member on chromosome X [Strongyloides ratti]|uniref:Dehydrogenase/reductase SDR family member on chromosome X n=1 Tax=Strongyloides ratti TaxID=34506 RepID=A0A090LSG6_STRRB|nr:Dehydrogenase/reductase SDR family member on chromosome X [Strongyloides ratti]CEF70553.2 Dehydrogenase/reductase SDR family member on chromosome X [Strongyloides ratti]
MEDVENYSEDVYDIKSLKKYIFSPMYFFSQKIGIPQLEYNDNSNNKINKILFPLSLIPLIGAFIYHIILSKSYTFLTLKSLENSLINLSFIHAIVAIIFYNNLKNTKFYFNFIKYFKEYKEIQFSSSHKLQRNYKKAKIKIFIFWFLVFTTFLYDSTINFINYDKNLNNQLNYKLSMFYGKSTYIFDILLLLYSKIVIVISASIYSGIYGILYYETEVFNNETQHVIEKTFSTNFSDKLDLISLKHSKLYKLITFSHQIIGKYTDFAIFNCTTMIIFGISVYRYYSSTLSNIFITIQYILPIICIIYLEIIILLPICLMEKNLQNIKNNIINTSQIWETKHSLLHGTALSIVTRCDHCDYHGLLIGLIPFNDKTIPILLLIIVILSSLLGKQFDEEVSAEGKVAVVTGASSGIGKCIAEDLNKRGAKVYMVCRNKEKADKVVEELSNNGCDKSRLRVRIADMTDLESVRRFAHMFRDEEPTLDILINNAGVLGDGSFVLTKDGHELIWQANYLGHFMLTELLISQLRHARNGARIVNVSSMLYKNCNKDDITKEVINDEKKYRCMIAYSRSKAAQVMHARYLSKILAEQDIHNITINAVHPGAVHTNITHTSIFSSPLIQIFFAPIFWIFFKTEKDGAMCPLFAALSESLNGVTGKYFSECKEETLTPLVLDDEACKDLVPQNTNISFLLTYHKNIINISPNNFTLTPEDNIKLIKVEGINLKSISYVNVTVFQNNSTNNDSGKIINESFLRIRIFQSSTIETLVIVSGWIYFAMWSFSFYPQVFLNFKRKSVIGLNFDFLLINIIGFICYAIYNIFMFWHPIIEEQYQQKYERSLNPVLLNDVIFSIHALFISTVVIIQCFFFESGKQKISYTCYVFSSILIITGITSIYLPLNNIINWLEYLNILSYIKMATTLSKYIPQILSNYKRKSVKGWSVGVVVCDFAGGLMANIQMILQAINTNDWTGFLGNPVKFGLGFSSMLFDIVFLIQNFYLYPKKTIKNIEDLYYTTEINEPDTAESSLASSIASNLTFKL